MPGPRANNRLLNALAPGDFNFLKSDLAEEKLELRQHLERPNHNIEHVYFVETGIVSIVAKSTGDRRIEAGLIGNEGMTGIAVVMGNHRSPHEVYVQAAGTALRAPATRIRSLMQKSANARQLLLSFANVFMVQTAHTALANGRANIDERLARWLLMAHDRLGERQIKLTHEFLAVMLGVRRSGVTEALNQLETNALIRSSRGAIEIVDRVGLKKAAGASYGVPEAEYRRLIGV